MTTKIILVLALLCLHLYGHAQSVLDQVVSLHAQQQSIEQIVGQLRSRYGISISYSRDAVSLDAVKTIKANNRTLKQVLDELLEGTSVDYQVVGGQIVLKHNPAKKGSGREAHKRKFLIEKKTNDLPPVRPLPASNPIDSSLLATTERGSVPPSYPREEHSDTDPEPAVDEARRAELQAVRRAQKGYNASLEPLPEEDHEPKERKALARKRNCGTRP
ncbi:MAG: hypothetical protein HC842_07570 [Cytophagales bacterium]|nr:hypothetical protein [Cytophagales bacterium]